MAKVKTGTEQGGMTSGTHVKGIKQGNSVGNYDAQSGHNADGTSTAVRSTGVGSKASEPIDPSMPNLSPA